MLDTNKLYVDIASLLDLRQGVLSSLVEDEQILLDYLVSEDYNYRDNDLFPIVTPEEYSKAKANISKDDLPNSSLTHIIVPIRNKILSMEKITSMTSDAKPVELLVNLYPISLTNQERDHIQNLIFIKLNTECIVTLVSIPPQQLSPSYIKQSGIASVFIYEFSEWLNLHNAQLDEVDLKEINFYFPALQKKEPSKEEVKQIEEVGFKDMFSYMEFLLSRVLSVSFLPTVFYSNLVTTAVYLTELNQGLDESPLEEVDISHLDIPDIQL